MAERLYRAQILLEKEQHEVLAEMAEAQDRSISDLVREIIDDYLSQREEDDQLERELEALHRLREIREEARQRYGVYQGDLIREVREERDQDVDRIWKGEA
jgi:hypothetical protein